MGSQPFNVNSTNTERPCLRFLSESLCIKVLILSGSDNTIRDNITHLCNVPNMKTLKLDIKRLDHEVVEHLVRLKVELHLRIHGNDYEQSLKWVKFLPTLTSFDVQLRRLRDLPFPLKRLYALTNLAITTETVYVGDIVNLLGVRAQLESFNLTLTNTNGLALNVLCKCQLPLTDLSVIMPFFETDGSLGLCTKLKTLKILAMRETFSGKRLACLESLKQLREMSIIGCSNWEPILPVLSPTITRLTMGQTSNTGTVFGGILHLPFLRHLTLYLCPFLDSLNPVKELRHLTSLTVSKCFQIEEALDTVLVSSLPEGLKELSLGFIDESGLEAHQSLPASLKDSYPCLEVTPAMADALLFEY